MTDSQLHTVLPEVSGLDRVEPAVLTLPIHTDVLAPFHTNNTARAEFVADLFNEYATSVIAGRTFQVQLPARISGHGDYEFWQATFAKLQLVDEDRPA